MKKSTTTGAVVTLVIAAVSAGCGGGGGGSKREGKASAALVATRVLAGSTVEARTGHQAIATEDGMSVLIVGGKTLTAEASDTAELWRAGRSAPLPVSMLEPRAGHVALYLPTGEIWIAGGHDARGVALSTTELFDPTTREFRPGPALKAPRDEAAVTYTPDGFLFAFGRGQDTIETWSADLTRSASFKVTERERVVDRITLTTSEREGPSQGRRGARALFSEDGKAFVSGGTLDSGQPALPLWIDPKTGRGVRSAGVQHQTGEHHVVNGHAVVAMLDGKAEGYVVGGWIDGQPWQDLQRVRSNEPAFERVPGGLAFPRERATVVSLEGGILVAGGRFGGAPVDQIEVVTRSGNGRAPNLEVARFDAQGTRLADGSVLITGGIGRDGLPVGVSELIVPAGVRAPGAEDVFAQARREKAELDRLVAERDAAVAEVARLNGALAAKQAQLAAAEQRARQLEANIARANADLAAARADVQSARAEVEALKKQVADAQAAAAKAAADAAAAKAAADAAARAATATTGTSTGFQVGAVTTLSAPVAPFRTVGSTGVSYGSTFGPILRYPAQDQVPADSRRR